MKEEWKEFRRKGIAVMRPYVPGENMEHISISEEDKPEAGGMIARSPNNAQDLWYVSKSNFEKNFEPVPAHEKKVEYTDSPR